MWKPAEAIDVTAEERSLLKQLLTAANTPQNVAVRIRVILGAAEGVSNNELAEQLSTSRMTILKWRKRFVECGIEGILTDAPRSGRKRRIFSGNQAGTIDATLKNSPENVADRRTRFKATTEKMRNTSVRRIRRTHWLETHRVENFNASQYPEFVPTVQDIVGLYKNPPEKVLVFRVDGSQIPTSERSEPILPPRERPPEKPAHDYRRYGTTTLLAALNVFDGTGTGHCSPRHRHQEFLKFLNELDASMVEGQQVHLVLDNYRAHRHPTLKAWIAERRNYHLHFTRTGSSWLDLIEHFRPHIDRGTLSSVPSLIKAITDYIQDYSKNPKPFAWVASTDHSIERARVVY
jgi:transposase